MAIIIVPVIINLSFKIQFCLTCYAGDQHPPPPPVRDARHGQHGSLRQPHQAATPE